MIGKLSGRIDCFGEDHLILDVGGVGYVVHCSSRTLQKAPRIGEAASFAIETQVREDSIRLFGFAGETERDWFRLLQSVQGVGAKVALGLLGAMTPGEIAGAIAAKDKAMIARAPGVGPKLAQRLVTELEGKAPVGVTAEAAAALRDGGESKGGGPASDAISALVNLGYGRPQAAAAIAASLRDLGDGAEASALIRRGLRELAQ